VSALRDLVRPTGVITGGTGHRAGPSEGYVRFRASFYQHMGLVAELNGPVVVTGGMGLHTIVDRPLREGLTTYAGRPPLQMRIPLLFDQWQVGQSVDPVIRMLEKMHGRDETIPEPPAMIIEGKGVPHNYRREPNLRFVFDGDPEWDDDVRYSHGVRCYASCVVTVMQKTGVTVLPDPKSGHARRYFRVQSQGPRSLRTIGRYFHVEGGWRTMMRLNPSVRDVDRMLKVGEQVRYQ
jgi:hypothetical protein